MSRLQARVRSLEYRKSMDKHAMTWGEFCDNLQNPESEVYKSIEAEHKRFTELPQEERDKLVEEATANREKYSLASRRVYELFYSTWNDELLEIDKPEKEQTKRVEPVREVDIDSILEIEIEPELKAEMMDFLTEYEDEESERNYQREEERQKRIDLLRKLAKGCIINE